MAQPSKLSLDVRGLAPAFDEDADGNIVMSAAGADILGNGRSVPLRLPEALRRRFDYRSRESPNGGEPPPGMLRLGASNRFASSHAAYSKAPTPRQHKHPGFLVDFPL